MSVLNQKPIETFVHTWKSPEDALAVDTNILIAPFDLYIISGQEVHSTAGSDGGAVTFQLTKETGTTAPGAGTDLLATACNLKATANTVQDLLFVTTAGYRNFAKGDRLGIDFAGTQTAVAGLTITLVLARNAD